MLNFIVVFGGDVGFISWIWEVVDGGLGGVDGLGRCLMVSGGFLGRGFER